MKPKKSYTHEEYVQALEYCMEQIGTAILRTLVGHLKFGQQRCEDFVAELNTHLPEAIKYNVDTEVNKQKWKRPCRRINQEQLWDLVEILINTGCNKSCNKKKNDCQKRKFFIEKNIPMLDEQATSGCEYKEG